MIHFKTNSGKNYMNHRRLYAIPTIAGMPLIICKRGRSQTPFSRIMDYNVTDNNVHINRSCDIRKKDFQSSLLHIRELYPDCKVFINRTLLSLKFEWACHNFLYQLHIARERVESVDLNWPMRWWVELLYHVGGFFVWIFVR